MPNEEITLSEEEQARSFKEARRAEILKRRNTPVKKRKQKKRIIASINKKIKKERFDAGTFYSAILVSLILDTVGIFGLGTIGVILAFIANPLLAIILWKVGSSNAKAKAKRMTLMSILEFAPLISIVPWWTFMIIKMKWEHDDKVRHLERKLKKLEKL